MCQVGATEPNNSQGPAKTVAAAINNGRLYFLSEGWFFEIQSSILP